MFWVQIPVDACPLFSLKRRSFLFVIDKKILIRKSEDFLLFHYSLFTIPSVPFAEDFLKVISYSEK